MSDTIQIFGHTYRKEIFNYNDNETIDVGSVKFRKIFLLEYDRIYKPWSYNLKDYIEKFGFQINNPYIPTDWEEKAKCNIDGHIYYALGGFAYRVYLVQKGNCYGLIDEYENILLPVEFKTIVFTNISTNPFLRLQDSKGKWYLYDVLRFEKISEYYEDITVVAQHHICSSTTDSYMKIYNGGKCGIIHETGEIIIPPVYDDCYGSCWFVKNDKEHKYIIVTQDNKTGILNELGDVVAEIKYDSIRFSYITGEEANNIQAIGKIGNDEILLIDPEIKQRKVMRNSSWTRPTYEKYNGSYAQDEMGYTDDDIDTIFDGDSDAYWNID